MTYLTYKVLSKFNFIDVFRFSVVDPTLITCAHAQYQSVCVVGMTGISTNENDYDYDNVCSVECSHH